MKRRVVLVFLLFLLLLLLVGAGAYLLQPDPAPLPNSVDIGSGSAGTRDEQPLALENNERQDQPTEGRAPDTGKPSEGAEAQQDKTDASTAPTPPTVTVPRPDWQRSWGTATTLTFRLRGRVVTDQGIPVTGASVHVDGWLVADVGEIPEGMTVSPAQDSFDDTEVAVTDTDGRFDVIVALPMSFEKAAMGSFDVVAIGQFATSDVLDYDWYADRPDDPVELVLPAKGGVSGRVVDAWGAGVGGVAVLIYDPESDMKKWVANSSTDANGAFEVRNLRAGKWLVKLGSREWIPTEEFTEIETYAEVVVALENDLQVTPRRRINLTLSKGGDPFELTRFTIRYVLPDESTSEVEVSVYKSGNVRLTDPPPTATHMLLLNPDYQTLEVKLPDMTEPGAYDLGTFLLTSTR